MKIRTLVIRTLAVVATLLMAYACLAAIHTGRIAVGRFNARTVYRETSPGKFWAYVVVCMLGTLVFAVGMIGTFFRRKAPGPGDS